VNGPSQGGQYYRSIYGPSIPELMGRPNRFSDSLSEEVRPSTVQNRRGPGDLPLYGQLRQHGAGQAWPGSTVSYFSYLASSWEEAALEQPSLPPAKVQQLLWQRWTGRTEGQQDAEGNNLALEDAGLQHLRVHLTRELVAGGLAREVAEVMVEEQWEAMAEEERGRWRRLAVEEGMDVTPTTDAPVATDTKNDEDDMLGMAKDVKVKTESSLEWKQKMKEVVDMVTSDRETFTRSLEQVQKTIKKHDENVERAVSNMLARLKGITDGLAKTSLDMMVMKDMEEVKVCVITSCEEMKTRMVEVKEELKEKAGVKLVEEILYKVEMMTRKVGGLERKMRHMQEVVDRIRVLAGEEEPRSIMNSDGEEGLGSDGVKEEAWGTGGSNPKKRKSSDLEEAIEEHMKTKKS